MFSMDVTMKSVDHITTTATATMDIVIMIIIIIITSTNDIVSSGRA
jgi:hypothetical protein